MIQYKLKCENGHEFTSWFKSASAYDALERSGHVSCAVCGTTNVSKTVMAPRVAKAVTPSEESAPHVPQDAVQALAALKSHVEKNADYVGTDFARQARSMHLGDAPERAIFGEAGHEDAKALIEDGVPMAPLPFVPSRKAH